MMFCLQGCSSGRESRYRDRSRRDNQKPGKNQARYLFKTLININNAHLFGVTKNFPWATKKLQRTLRGHVQKSLNLTSLIIDLNRN